MVFRRRWLLAVLIAFPLAATALFAALAPHAISHCGDMREMKVKADVHAIAEAIAEYRWDHGGALPTTDEGIGKLVIAGYFEKMLVDPWGREYRYVRTGEDGYSVICLGADGKPGGADQDADIDSPMLLEHR